MTKDQAIKHLKLMQSGARNAIRFKKNDKEISEEERKEDIEIYQDQLEALNLATNALEQQPSDDCISRAELKKWLDMNFSFGGALRKLEIFDRIDKELPPVTPTRKSGLHWIERFKDEDKWLECPHCHKDSDNAYAYCPNCGASFKEEK